MVSSKRLAAVIENFISAQKEQRGIILDDVQRQALYALSRGVDVLLSAPTGSGKTMVALGAVELACARSVRCVYTAPIKALSNQKYHDLCTTYGKEHVGLLTGDVTINRDADIVVVTTEVLRNMLYAHDSAVADIGYVVLDEVHYLADPVRGPVWEEIILQLPSYTRLVSLSATMPNVTELHAWLESIHGPTELIVSTVRPVPLVHYLCARTSLLELLDDQGKVTPKAIHALNSIDAADNASSHSSTKHRSRHRHTRFSRQYRVTSTDRRRIIKALSTANVLPAIEFIFSRKGCDKAVGDLLDSDICLTTPAQKAQIESQLALLRAQLSTADARTVRFNFWSRALSRGFGAHHAGMFPAIKELVERLMNQGLLSIVYATGTLALGIDMPVRTVVLEDLRRFNGTDFVDLTGTEYTQLIGRAGRRGKDKVGNAVILASPSLSLPQLSDLASGSIESLHSAFFPSYNAVANLLRFLSYDDARSMMGRSFAQFQANSHIVELEARARRIRIRIEKLEKKLENACPAGSVAEYARLRDRAGRASKAERRKAKAAYKAIIHNTWERASIGTIYAYAYQGALQYGVMLSKHKERMRMVTPEAKLRWVHRHDLTSELRDVGQATMPFGMSFKDPIVREQLAEEILDVALERIDLGTDRDLTGSWDRTAQPKDPRLHTHPVHSCPDLPYHLNQTRELITLDQQLSAITHQVSRSHDSVAREFDATADVLDYLGYLHKHSNSKDSAQMVKLGIGAELLSGIHNESDLLITQCLMESSFAQLAPSELAGICTCFLGDRRLGELRASLPATLIDAWNAVERNYQFLAELERRHHIDRTPEPSNGGVEAFMLWAQGAALSDILRTFRIDVGDFMAANRRLIDLLGQIAAVTADSPIGSCAATAMNCIKRWEWM